MNLAPIELKHGEVYGKLTVLEVVKGTSKGTVYRCGCVCGFSDVRVRAKPLMTGKVSACLKCRDHSPSG